MGYSIRNTTLPASSTVHWKLYHTLSCTFYHLMYSTVYKILKTNIKVASLTEEHSPSCLMHMLLNFILSSILQVHCELLSNPSMYWKFTEYNAMYGAIYSTVFSKMWINKYISFLKEELSSSRLLDVCVQCILRYSARVHCSLK